jgi:hypothetical protein
MQPLLESKEAAFAMLESMEVSATQRLKDLHSH